MKTLILAAGYGTRLERDLKDETAHRHLIGVPKPLLPIGGVPLITRWTKTLHGLPSIDDQVFVVVCIALAVKHFWRESFYHMYNLCL